MAHGLLGLAFDVSFALASASMAVRAAEEPSTDPKLLRQIANQILTADASDVSGFFRMVRQANPSKGAIKTMREINKAMQEEEDAVKEGRAKATDPRVYSAQETAALQAKFKQAQTLVKDTILSSRRQALAKFAEDHPDLVRLLNAFGDIGSWRTSTDVNSDADYTVYGADPRVNHLFVYQYLAPMLIRAQNPQTGAEPLLGMRPAGEHGGDQGLGVRPDLAGPAAEAIRRPLGVMPMGTGHVIGIRAVLAAHVAAPRRRN